MFRATLRANTKALQSTQNVFLEKYSFKIEKNISNIEISTISIHSNFLLEKTRLKAFKMRLLN